MVSKLNLLNKINLVLFALLLLLLLPLTPLKVSLSAALGALIIVANFYLLKIITPRLFNDKGGLNRPYLFFYLLKIVLLFALVACCLLYLPLHKLAFVGGTTILFFSLIVLSFFSLVGEKR